MIRHGTFFAFFITFLSLSLCVTAPTGFAQNVSGVQIRTVVIDPGHGGRDPGAVGPSGKNLERQITLSVALKLGKLIENAYPDVKVLFTRKTDTFVPLASRTAFANNNHADLFISIHVNAFRNNTAPSGSETFVMGVDKSDSSMEVSKLENSVIAYEEDYSTVYQGFDPNNPESYIIFNLLQNAHLEQSVQFADLVQKSLGRNPISVNRGVKQGPMLVLWQTTMPAVLVELGFLTNAKDRAVLISEDGQQKLAAALFNAFKLYKTGYDTQLLPIHPNPVSVIDTPMVQKPDTASLVYRVQIFAIGRLLPSNAPEFKGYANIHYKKVEHLYKYTTGSFTNKVEAQAYCYKVRKDFPQAFVVEDRL